MGDVHTGHKGDPAVAGTTALPQERSTSKPLRATMWDTPPSTAAWTTFSWW